MLKRALSILVATLAVATVLAFTVSPISPSTAWAALTAKEIKESPNKAAPKTTTKAVKVLRANVMKLASDYAHHRYRAICADLTAKQRQHLGGTTKCMLAVALVNAFVPIKKFTITSATVAKSRLSGAVSLYVNGNKKHALKALVKWEGGRYRLDSQSGWHPKL
ncbi:MAG TPA: hypothetical protein VGC96_09210 [Candidatus Elarobacter sp.]|jgi:hypothetical protein